MPLRPTKTLMLMSDGIAILATSSGVISFMETFVGLPSSGSAEKVATKKKPAAKK